MNRGVESSFFVLHSFAMETQYKRIILENLRRAFQDSREDLQQHLPARGEQGLYRLRAFGEDCVMGPEGILLGGTPETGPKGVVISLYAMRANASPLELMPLRSFKDLPGSMPYQGAFTANAERPLIPHVRTIRDRAKILLAAFDGEENPAGAAGDFSLLLHPLPKVALCYVFYMEDEEFPPSAACLFSVNALSFLPMDGLADVAEYTTRTILHLLQEGS
ncbi:MAG: DUF3786 domain-containing protein [Thermodesulfobacteriota bacterium]